MAASPNQVLAVSPRLDFFQPNITDSSVDGSHQEEYSPIGYNPENTSDPIKFHIRGTEHWIDWSKSQLYLKGTIIGVVGNDPATAKKATEVAQDFALTNNFLHNVFSSHEVRVNNTPISSANDNYPYSAYIQSLFNHSLQSEYSLGALSIWHTDEPGKMNAFSAHKYGTGNDAAKIATHGNLGAITRFKHITNGDKPTVEGVIQLFSPLFQLDTNLSSFANIDITLNRNVQPAFKFMYKDETCPFQFRIDTIKLKIRKVKLQASIVEGIERMMDKESEPLTYKLLDSRVFTKTYAGYGTEIIEDNLFHGIVPNRIVFGFVDNDAYTGKFVKNPFKFEHLFIQEVSVMLNGQHYPLPPLHMDFEKGQTAEAFYLMMDSLQSIKSAAPPIITHEMFKNGYTLFSFDMSADQHGAKNHYQISNQPANIRLHVRFKQGDAAKNVTLVIYYEVNSLLSINKTRQVTVYSK